jgi:predicted transcriptional regulator
MKTVVSIPDELLRKGEALARRLGKSRSEIYREALAEYVARRESGAVTAALDQVADEIDGDTDAWLSEAGRQALARSER